MTVYIILALVILGFIGLLGVLVLKQKKKKKNHNAQFTYTTSHGVRVKLSEKTKGIPASDFEEWTNSVVDFWFEKKGWAKNEITGIIKNISIFIYDQEYLDRVGAKVNGINYPDNFLIEMASLPKNWVDDSNATYTPYVKVKSLFRHEVSHLVVGWVGGIQFDNEIHHTLFNNVGLGA